MKYNSLQKYSVCWDVYDNFDAYDQSKLHFYLDIISLQDFFFSYTPISFLIKKPNKHSWGQCWDMDPEKKFIWRRWKICILIWCEGVWKCWGGRWKWGEKYLALECVLARLKCADLGIRKKTIHYTGQIKKRHNGRKTIREQCEEEEFQCTMIFPL